MIGNVVEFLILLYLDERILMALKGYNRFTALMVTLRKQKDMPMSQEMTDFIYAKNNAGIVSGYENVPEQHFRLKAEFPNDKIAKAPQCATCNYCRKIFGTSSSDASNAGPSLYECRKYYFKMRKNHLTTCGTWNVSDR